MKFNRENWNKVEIGNIVSELRNNAKDPLKEGYEKYIGFEHIIPEDLTLKQFGSLQDGVTFTKTFEENDVLFGKIRAYLKKVAVAPIKGICSGDILVLRTKDDKKLKQSLLPYYLTTQSFLQRAINSSIGTTLPRTKWQFLSKHEICIPTEKEQVSLVQTFNAIECSIEHLILQERRLRSLCQNLIDNFVSASPVFGNLLNKSSLTEAHFTQVAEKVLRKIDPLEYGVKRIVAGENLESEDFKIRTWGIVGKDFLGPAFHVLFQPGDILYGSRRTYLRKVALADFEGVCANTTYVIRANEDVLLQQLLKHVMLSERFTQYSISVSKGSTNPYINWKDLDNFSFLVPEKEIQYKIVKVLDDILSIAEECRNQRISLKNLKTKLLNEILG